MSHKPKILSSTTFSHKFSVTRHNQCDRQPNKQSCFAYVELATFLLVWSNPNQSNRRSIVQQYFPYGECSLLDVRTVLRRAILLTTKVSWHIWNKLIIKYLNLNTISLCTRSSLHFWNCSVGTVAKKTLTLCFMC